MTRRPVISLAVLVVCVALPAWADEIVYFKNGTTMEVETHSVTDGVVKVQMGGNALMAFPVEQIERIETRDGNVAPLYRPEANRMVPSTTAATVQGSVPSQYRRDQWQGGNARGEDNNVDTDANGMAVVRPFGKDGPENKRKFGVAGTRGVGAQLRGSRAGLANATRIGSRYALPGKQSGAPRQQPVGLSPKAHK